MTKQIVFAQAQKVQAGMDFFQVIFGRAVEEPPEPIAIRRAHALVREVLPPRCTDLRDLARLATRICW